MSSEPSCPICSSKMVLRTARRGSNAGNQFWGCSQYPRCKGITNIDGAEQKQTESSENTVTQPDNQKRKVVWYDNFSRKGYSSEYVTLGSTPLFLSDFNLASIGGAKSQFNLLSKKFHLRGLTTKPFIWGLYFKSFLHVVTCLTAHWASRLHWQLKKTSRIRSKNSMKKPSHRVVLERRHTL